jgi:hypothetical protein
MPWKRRYTWEEYLKDCKEHGYVWLEDGRCCPKNVYAGVLDGTLKLPEPTIGVFADKQNASQKLAQGSRVDEESE